jgi:multiple sugar transport system substrate-binding protein
MLIKNFKMKLVTLLTLSFLLLTACGNNGSVTGKTPPTVPDAPATVKLFSSFNFSDDYINTIFVQPLKEKYPNITLEISSAKEMLLEDRVTTGDVPDLIITSALNLQDLINLGLMYDQNELIKQHHFDLQRIDPSIMDMIKAYSDKGEIFGIPYTSNFSALFYNKDIFEKFGVPFPKDGMTWDEVIELAKKLTRNEDGVQYVGLDPDSIIRISSPLTNTYFDKKTGKANLSTPEWKEIYELFNKIISIPGNRTQTVKRNQDDFMKLKNVAMKATANAFDKLGQTEGLNWDMVTYPVYKNKPGTFGVAGAQALIITPNSKVKEQAFEVIETLLSDEVQLIISKSGVNTPLKSKEVRKAFGSDLEFLKGKNTQATFKYSPTVPGYTTEFDTLAKDITYTHSLDLYNGKDINTVIRETEDEINAKVNENKSK